MITGVEDEINFLELWEAESKKKSIGTEVNYRASEGVD